MIATLPYTLLAQAYGEGAYNTSTYGGATAPTTITVGPITLPVTGPGAWIVAGAALVAIAAGIIVWVWQRRSHAPQSKA